MSSEFESVLLSRSKERMVEYLEDHPEMFQEAVRLSLTNTQPLAWRTTWAIGGVLEKNDPRIEPYISKILDKLPGLDDGHQREFLKILYEQENLAEIHEGLLFDCCTHLWEQVRRQPSVRYYAFQMMVKISENHPELRNEIRILMQPQYMNALSPGIRKIVKRKIREFDGN